MKFDGAFSNFAGLNCVRDLPNVALALATHLRPGASALVCLSTRFCLWEALFYFAKGELRKATRRWAGESQATVGRVAFPVFYPTTGALRRAFSPLFRLRSVTGIGITVPPSYLDFWIGSRPQLLRTLCNIDAVICGWPFFRSVGDHILLELELVQEKV